MSTRNNSNKSSKSSSSSTSRTQQTPTATTQTTASTTRRARKPMTIRVRATGEEIRRVPVQRSGYSVVRYGGYYHTVRGGGRTAPYIVGSEDSEDMLGRA